MIEVRKLRLLKIALVHTAAKIASSEVDIRGEKIVGDLFTNNNVYSKGKGLST